MLVSDLITPAQEKWLKDFVGSRGDDVLRLYLVYNESYFGPDSAREIWDNVVGGDFVANGDSGIVSNEDLRVGIQNGISHPAPQTRNEAKHHWWIECILDKDISDLF